MALELFINGTQSGAVGQINLYGDEPIQLNISVGDIRDISKKNSTFSQTFTIPADANNNILLNHIFNIGSDSSFDASKKTQCFMLNDGISVFNGQFQLTKINVKNRNIISYECVVYGETIDLVKTLGDKLLTNLDFTELDHIYSVDNIEASWTADTKSLGYYYPLIDYGYDLNISNLNSGLLSIVLDSGLATSAISTTMTDTTKLWVTNAFATRTLVITEGTGYGQTRTIVSNTLTQLTISSAWVTLPDSTSKYNITQVDYTNIYGSTGNGISPLLFKPALSNTYLLNKIFHNVGFSLDSDIINSDVIGETIIPYNADVTNAVPKSYMDEYAFRAAKTVDEQCGDASGYVNILAFQNSTTGVNYDPGNLWNQDPMLPWRYTADRVCTMSFVVNLRWYVTGYNVVAPKNVTVKFFRDSYGGGTTPFSVRSYTTPGVPTMYIDYNNSFQSDVLDNPTSTLGLHPLLPGENVWATHTWQFGGGNHLIYVRHTYSYMYNVPTPKLVPDGKLFYNYFVPKNIKQVDYVKSIITMFNLMVIPDKNNPKRLKIITRNDYYKNANIKNWTSKVDHTDKIEETLLSEQQNRTIKLTYKQDKDYYNTNYFDKTNTIYGEHVEYINNEWVDGEKKIEVIFSPSPTDKVLGSDINTGIYLPKIIKRDDKTGVYSRTDANIRFLRKRPTLMPTSNTIQMSGKPPMNFYPYAGHLDHPIDPTVDYNFGQIQFAYYPELTNMTENNLVETYWQQYLDDINDKNSKLIKCKIYLTPDDIAKFDYNDSIFIDGLTDDGGHYFNVNKITYVPTSNLPSVVELIKVNRKPTEKRRRYTILTEQLGPVRALDLGKNNILQSGGVIVLGENNNIGYNAETTMIIGNNNTVANNATNVVLINSYNQNVTEPFTTIVGNSYFPQQGESYTLFNDIDSGLDMVINPFSNTILNDIDSGIDAVRNIGGQSIISDIDSGVDGTKI